VKTLLIVDLQCDFLPGGALAVPQGDRIVPVINRLMSEFQLVLATKDWHPSDHASFASQHPGRKIGDVIPLEGVEQILWPDHCVQETPGAEFAPGLDVRAIERTFFKGIDRKIDSYSAFFDNAHRRSTGLDDYLKDSGVIELAIVGLATDYCVQFTAIDAIELGYQVRVLAAGCRAVNLKPDDGRQALQVMRQAGAEICD
jgi:nicotinamidase/pyrazinamidase